MVQIGDRIGGHEVVARLKSGGMATLFIGRRRGAAGFEKHVALKVVHDHLAKDPVFVQMFVHEALLSARISHPNVVHVEELIEAGGQHVLVMEYVHGCALGRLLRALALRKRRMHPDLAGYIALEVADGLHAAHETRDDAGALLGVVHRDVSPENILLAYQGNVKLIDFGVAKTRGRAETKHAIKGKFRYMAPEQAAGGEVDRRTDVYALGIVLWEMLTMRRRFDAESDIDVLRAVRNPRPVPPSVHCTDIDPALDAVVLKAMQPDPDARFANAHELRTALVEACPRAASMHESMLAGLLDATMNERKQQQRAELPVALAGRVRAEEVGGELAAEALQTMTVSATSIDILPDMVSSSVVAEADTRLMDPEELPPLDESADADAAAGSRRAPVPRWVVVLLVTCGLAFFVGVGAALIAHQMDDATPIVRPLPEPASSEPRVAAPTAERSPAEEDGPAQEVVAPIADAEDRQEEPGAHGRAPETGPPKRGNVRERTSREPSTKRAARSEQPSVRRGPRTPTEPEGAMTPTTMRITTEFF